MTFGTPGPTLGPPSTLSLKSQNPDQLCFFIILYNKVKINVYLEMGVSLKFLIFAIDIEKEFGRVVEMTKVAKKLAERQKWIGW
jgi:hypothetical protein